MAVIAVVFGLLSRAFSQQPSPAPNTGGFRHFVLGSKVTRPIALKDEPVGPGGVHWYSPAYNDGSWQAGLLDAVNPIPERMSKLWRIYLRVDAPPVAGASVKLRVEGDDAVTLYLDGFLLGKSGNAQSGQPGTVEIEAAPRLSAGMHVVGVRVDNGPAGSRMKFSVIEDSPAGTGSIKKNYWSIQTTGDEAARKQAALAVRQAAQQSPQDPELCAMALHSLTEGPRELRDIANAERDLADMRRRGVAVPLSTQVTVARAAGKLETFLPELRRQASDPKNWNGYLLLSEALKDIGEKEGAFLALQDAFKANAPDEKQNFRMRLQIIERLLDLGRVDAASPPLGFIGERIRAMNDGALLIQLSQIHERVGNRKMAEDLCLLGEQRAGSGQGAFAIERRSRRLLDSGEFEACVAVVQTSIDSQDMTSGIKEMIGVYRVLALVELGRMDEAKRAAAAIPWAPKSADDQPYLLRYLRVARALGIQASIRTAAEHLDRSLAASSQDSRYFKPASDILIELALAHRDLGDQARARQRAEEILKSVPDSTVPMHQFLRGRALRVTGDETRAVAALTKALSLDTSNYWIKKELGRSIR